MEDEERLTFYCLEYNTCRLKYPEIFLPMEKNIEVLLNNVNQISNYNFLWDIRHIRVSSGKEYLYDFR